MASGSEVPTRIPKRINISSTGTPTLSDILFRKTQVKRITAIIIKATSIGTQAIDDYKEQM